MDQPPKTDKRKEYLKKLTLRISNSANETNKQTPVCSYFLPVFSNFLCQRRYVASLLIREDEWKRNEEPWHEDKRKRYIMLITVGETLVWNRKIGWMKVQNHKLRTVSVRCSQLIHTLSTCSFNFLVLYFSRKRYSQHCGYTAKTCGR